MRDFAPRIGTEYLIEDPTEPERHFHLGSHGASPSRSGLGLCETPSPGGGQSTKFWAAVTAHVTIRHMTRRLRAAHDDFIPGKTAQRRRETP